MKRKRNIVLGISPGTRSFGYAVLRDGELVNWGLKTYRGKWSKGKQRTILDAVDELIVLHGITGIGAKVNHPSRSSKALESLYRKINQIAKKRNLHISCFTLGQLKLGNTDKQSLVMEFFGTSDARVKINPRAVLAILASMQFNEN